MSSETDHPRQRTVAELLAAHGDATATGSRRRRRREPDEPDEGAPGTDAPDWRAAPPREAGRAAPGDAVPPVQRENGGRRRAGDEPPWGGARRAPEQPTADPWGGDADDWASEKWDGAERDPWDSGRREPPTRAARRQPWDAAADQDTRYADAEPPEPPAREQPPRRAQRRAAEERDAPSWEPREPTRSWEPRPAEPPRRSREREAPAWEPRDAEPEGRAGRSRERPWDGPPPDAPPRRAAPEDRAPADPARDLPTEQMPRVRRAAPVDPAATSRIPQRRRPDPELDEADDDGPPTMVGAAPAGAEAWHRARTDGRRRTPDPDGAPGDDDGPATMVGAAPAGAEAWHRARTDGRRRPDGDGGPPTQAAAPLSFDDDEDEPADGARDYPAGLDGPGLGEEPTGFFAPDADAEPPVRRRSAQTEAKEQSGTPSWPAVIAQWILGAIGGALLWVGFRFLWRDLEIVALAAAVLVTVGLVVVVRALLRSNDMRTTLFAVLVGLLLTVSPAILVLLGK